MSEQEYGIGEGPATRISLLDTGLHGHKYAIDAVVAEMALRRPAPVVVLTSDADDMSTLCGPTVRLIPL